MAGQDADFTAYVAARWPALVRSVVLFGCPRPEAESVVVAGLARCSTGWDRVQRSDDVETHVYRAVVECWHQHERHEAPVVEPERSEEEAELERLLRPLTAPHREALVLRAVGGLSDPQVADVLDLTEETVRKRVPGAPRDEAVRSVAAAVDVSPPAYAAVMDRARTERRRHRRTALAGLAAGLVVVGLGVGAVVLSGGGVRERSVDVVPLPNPIDLPWYAGGRLHLDSVAVELPGVTDLTVVDDAVVYLDEDGIVGQVDPDGRVLEVGAGVPGSSLLGSSDEDWAAWLEPGDPDGRLVVWDVGSETEVGGLRTSTAVQPIAIDQGLVHLGIGDRDFTWEPPDAEPERLQPTNLLDVSAATRVYQRTGRIEIVQPVFLGNFLRIGEGGRLSPGGAFVLTREPGPWQPGEPYRPLMYDTRTGVELPTGIAAGERVVAAAFTSRQDVVYLVQPDGADSDLLVLRTCQLDAARCGDVTPVDPAGTVLLAD